MANANTTVEFVTLPSQGVTTTTETALLVPASGYPTLPSPTFAAGAGLTIGVPTDIAGSVFDGHAFKVRVVGKVTTGGAITVQPKLYQVPGTIIAQGTQGTVANDNVTVSLAATTVSTTTVNFIVEAQYLWDSTTKKLNGFVTVAQIGGVNVAANSGTAGTFVATTAVSSVGITDLNFLPTFTFGTANAANAILVTEFALDRA